MRMRGKRFYEFGPYRMDPNRNLLLRGGEPISLTSKAFEVLLVLVEHGDQAISKDELMQRLWPDTFVEEANLTKHISMVRKALGETAQDHRYILTLPGRGYRFAEKVLTISDEEPDLVLESHSLSRITIEQTEQIEPTDSGPANLTLQASTQHPWTRIFAFAAVVLALLIGAFFILRSRRAVALGETDWVLMSDFVNTTGEPVFDGALKQALTIQLAQSPFLNILSDARVGATLRLMTKPSDTKLTPELALDLCQRAGAKALIAGSIASLGRQYVIGLNAVNCQTGDPIVQEQATAGSKERVLKALDSAAARMRQKLGESIATIQRFDVPIEEATTPSLEALESLSEGRKMQQQKGNAAAIPYFIRAIELDPNFAAAHAALGTCYSNLREPALASENLRKAYELRGKVSQRENFQFSAYYYHLVTGELEKANNTYELWTQVYPRDNVPWSNLGVTYGYLGQYDKAIAEIQQAMRLNPASAVGYTNLVSHYAAVNRLEDATATYQQALARKLDNPYLHLNRFGVAFLQADAAEMQRQLDWAIGKPQAENLLLSAQSDTEAYYGRLSNAREFSRRASESAQRGDQKETAAEWMMNEALREAEFGYPILARQQVRAALAASNNDELQILGALALARAGEPAAAQQMVDDLAKRYPLDTVTNHYWFPSIRAAIAISSGRPAAALDVLQAATSPYELGNPLPQAEIGAFLYPVYLRAQSYLLLHRGNEAQPEFQKFLAHRGITANCPLGALALLGLARAYEQTGEKDKSRAEYREFLALWKGADPDVPILKEAKAEYAKLQ
jgi:DNA-binding winged helix-turn-helix (wHTH) protein/tetratricopeptide (TPR) repeat protein